MASILATGQRNYFRFCCIKRFGRRWKLQSLAYPDVYAVVPIIGSFNAH
jgi:hypothetical protein